MKFAHMADCHIGGWTDPRMKKLNNESFSQAVDRCIEERIAFLLIAGDLFSTALPGIDSLSLAVDKLKLLQDKKIPVYIIPGSHDHSPSGKSIIYVLEKAGLVTNVYDPEKPAMVEDPKTGALIAGVLGKKNGLESGLFTRYDGFAKRLDSSLKIFMFHSAIREFLPSEFEMMQAIPRDMLPSGFSYYAGGHVHLVYNSKDEQTGCTYALPGPLFPQSFSEIEKGITGGFYIVEAPGINLTYTPIKVCSFASLEIDCQNKTPEQVNDELDQCAEQATPSKTVVTVRLTGTLRTGKTSDIQFREFARSLYLKGALFVLKNTSKLASRDFEKIEVHKNSVEEIENTLIGKHAGEIHVGGWDKDAQQDIIRELMMLLDREPKEGEKKTDFEERIRTDTAKLIEKSFTKPN
jgi:exonuclease SbcD